MSALMEYLLPPSMSGTPARTVVEAHGTTVRFADGVEAVCATSGLWNVNFGYGNRFVADRVRPVLEGMHYSTLFRYTHPLAHEAADGLLELGDRVHGAGAFGRVAFSTSGSAGNDMAMKLARQSALLRGEVGRRLVVGLEGSYHGMTYGAMALSGDELNQKAYGVDRRSIRHLPHDDAAAWEDFLGRFGEQVSLVVLEPVQGTGAFEVDPEVLDVIGRRRAEDGFLVLADEVACGFHRTGPLFGSGAWPFTPDLMLVSKGMTNGLEAAAALLIGAETAGEFAARDALFVHGETQGGSPMACAATLGVLDQLADEDMTARAEALGERLGSLCERLAAEHGVRTHGRGLFRFLSTEELNDGRPFDGLAVVEAFRQNGVVVQPSVGGVQVMPQVVTDAAALDRLGEALDAGLRAVAASAPALRATA